MLAYGHAIALYDSGMLSKCDPEEGNTSWRRTINGAMDVTPCRRASSSRRFERSYVLHPKGQTAQEEIGLLQGTAML